MPLATNNANMHMNQSDPDPNVPEQANAQGEPAQQIVVDDRPLATRTESDGAGRGGCGNAWVILEIFNNLFR